MAEVKSHTRSKDTVKVGPVRTVDFDAPFYKMLKSTQFSVLLAALIISFSLLLSSGVISIKGVNKGNLGSAIQQQQIAGTNTLGVNGEQFDPGTAPVAKATSDPTKPVDVSVDDDPVIGEKEAKITMVEFSDYECPFCKRYFDETYPELKKDYVDTGKLKIVFRDLPLSFHANAQKQAEAANCSRDQGGDITYYKFHDAIFTKTTSNGTGLALDQLPVIAKELGLNVANFQQCLDSGKYKDEVTKDIADADKYGATGTPTFFIGKSTETGNIIGTKLVGAQPYSKFKALIDSLLQ